MQTLKETHDESRDQSRAARTCTRRTLGGPGLHRKTSVSLNQVYDCWIGRMT